MRADLPIWDSLNMDGVFVNYPHIYEIGYVTSAKFKDSCTGFFTFVAKKCNLLCFFGPTTVTDRDDACMGSFEEQMANVYGLKNTNRTHLVDHRFFALAQLVTLEAEADGWWERHDAIDGQDGMFLIGDLFSGFSVPPSIRWLYNRYRHEGDIDLLRTFPDAKHFENLGETTINEILNTDDHKRAIRVGAYVELFGDDDYIYPLTFVWVSLSLLAFFSIVESFVRQWCKIPIDKVKRVSVYIVETMVTLFILVVQVSEMWELLILRSPSDLLRTIKAGNFSAVVLAALYLFELNYLSDMRPSLRLHHVVSIVFGQIALSVEEKNLDLLRMCMYNMMFGTTEQVVFLLMLCYRFVPNVIRKHNAIAKAGVNFYMLSRLLLSGLGIVVYISFCRKLDWANASSGLKFLCQIYPVMVGIQLSTQVVCYNMLMGVVKSAMSSISFSEIHKSVRKSIAVFRKSLVGKGERPFIPKEAMDELLDLDQDGAKKVD